MIDLKIIQLKFHLNIWAANEIIFNMFQRSWAMLTPHPLMQAMLNMRTNVGYSKIGKYQAGILVE